MRTIAALIAGLLLLAACTGEPEVREPDPTTSTTAEGTSAAPTMPEQATEDSEEGRVAFVNHWIGLFNHAVKTGDGNPLSQASPDCAECKGYAEDFEGIDASERPVADVWDVRELGMVRGADEANIVGAKVVVGTSQDDQSEHQLFFRLTDAPPFKVTRVTREVGR